MHQAPILSKSCTKFRIHSRSIELKQTFPIINSKFTPFQNLIIFFKINIIYLLKVKSIMFYVTNKVRLNGPMITNLKGYKNITCTN